MSWTLEVLLSAQWRGESSVSEDTEGLSSSDGQVNFEKF